MQSGAQGSESEEMLARAKARLGTTLRGKWRLDAVLGLGGMGTVYAATHRNGTRAAVKLLHPELSAHPTIRQRFAREGQIANTIGHEGAVRILDDDTAEDGSIFLVAELLEGETLEQRRVRYGETIPEAELLPMMDAVLDVLAAAHDKGIIHRDLKPENVFLTRQGMVKLLDFGIARARFLDVQGTATAAGTPLGTPSFMAPEQARGRWDEVDAKTDIWACGATFFTAVAGRLVHEGVTTHNEALLSAMTNKAPPLASAAPHVSPGFAAVIDRALAFDKSARWKDAREMQQAVRQVLQGTAVPSLREEAVGAPHASLPALSSRPTTGGAGAVAVPVARRSGAGKWIAAAAALLVFGAVALVLTHRSSPHEAPAARTSLPPPPASMEAIPPPSQPTASAPPVESEPPAPSAKPTVSSAPTAPSRPKPSCTPPYVVDPSTGKKIWKVECL